MAHHADPGSAGDRAGPAARLRCGDDGGFGDVRRRFAFQAPISTTQTITSAIMGVGATRRLSAVRWGVAGNILVAWMLTLPMAALAAAITYAGVHLLVA